MVEKKAAKKKAVKSEKKTIRKTTAKTAARAAAAADKQYASADVVQEKKAIRQIKSNNKKDVKEIKKLEKKERKVQSLGHISQVTGAVVDVRFDKVEDCAVKTAVDNGFAKKGQHIIITAGFPLNVKGRTNMLHTVFIK